MSLEPAEGTNAESLRKTSVAVVETSASHTADQAGLSIASMPPERGPAPPNLNDETRMGVRQWFLFWPVLVYLLARGLTVAGAAAIDCFTHKSLSADLGVWDGQWFIRAAQHGWPNHLPLVHGPPARSTIAFFPLFPLAIRWLAYATSSSPLVVGLVISGVTGLTAVVAIGMLVRQYADSRQASRATLLFAVFPGTFVFSLAYAEGIAVTCVAFGLLALLRRKWWLAGVLGLLATAASPIALAFVLSCAWCAAREVLRHRTWQALLAPVLAPLGFMAYMGWLRAHTGTLSAWRWTERWGWNSYPSLTYPFRVIATFVRDPAAPTETGQILFVGVVVTVVGAVLAVRERQPSPVLIYGLTAACLAAVSSPVGLRPRFIMLAFPLVVAYGTRLRGRAYVGAVVVSAVLLTAVTVVELASTAVFP
jgi:hypothetical protein